MSEGESGLGRPSPSLDFGPGPGLSCFHLHISAYMQVSPVYSGRVWGGGGWGRHLRRDKGRNTRGCCLLEHPNLESRSVVHPPIRCLNL